jgi:hypothetical protein
MSDEQEQDPEITQHAILLMLMRLYDVEMSILSEMNDEHAEHLQNVHESGGLLTDFPWLRQDDQ